MQFEPEALKASIERLRALKPAWAYLTHFGRVGDVDRLAQSLVTQIDALVEIARAAAPGAGRHHALRTGLGRHLLGALREHGWQGGEAHALALLDMDIELNAQGLGVWLDRTR